MQGFVSSAANRTSEKVQSVQLLFTQFYVLQELMKKNELKRNEDPQNVEMKEQPLDESVECFLRFALQETHRRALSAATKAAPVIKPEDVLNLMIPDLEVRIEKAKQEIKAFCSIEDGSKDINEVIQSLRGDQSVEPFAVEKKPPKVPSGQTKK